MSSSRDRSESARESSVTPSTSAAETRAAKIARRRGRPMAMGPIIPRGPCRERPAAARALPRQGAPRKAGGGHHSGMPGPVLFDFGGTLDADGQPWVERFFRGYRAVGGG